jgi:hypothetical protein|tara:strand:+ start:13860 stop:14051 length:192 start_codon:yes stop_codon:yes gene_type:complete
MKPKFKLEKLKDKWDFIVINPRSPSIKTNGTREIRYLMKEEDLHEMFITLEEEVSRLPIKHEY